MNKLLKLHNGRMNNEEFLDENEKEIKARSYPLPKFVIENREKRRKYYDDRDIAEHILNMLYFKKL